MSAGFPAQFDDQRQKARTTTVYKAILVETAEVIAFCLLRNISSSGMIAKSFVEFAEGSAIKITFGCEFSVEGKVVWSREGRIGIQFNALIDVPQLLKQLSIGLPSGLKSKPPRFQIRTSADVSLRDRRMPVEVTDISISGVKVNAPSLQPEDELAIERFGMTIKKATERWTHTGIAELKFHVPLDFNQLAEWAIEQQLRNDRIPASFSNQSAQWENRL